MHIIVGILGLLLIFAGEPIATGQKDDAVDRGVPVLFSGSGDYVGVEPLPSLSSDEPKTKWFREHRMVVRDNEVVLDMVPFTTHRGKKSYSASDGGFLTYRGRIKERDGKLFISLRLFTSDYVIFKKGFDPYSEIKTYSVTTFPGGLIIDGIRYERTSLSKTVAGELVRYIKKESMGRASKSR